jgi:hypothetical protein
MLVCVFFVVAGSYCIASDSELTGPVGIWLGTGSGGIPLSNEGQAYGISYDKR